LARWPVRLTRSFFYLLPPTFASLRLFFFFPLLHQSRIFLLSSITSHTHLRHSVASSTYTTSRVHGRTSLAAKPHLLSTAFSHTKYRHPPLFIMAGKKLRCSASSCREPAQRIVGDCSFCQGHFCGRHRLLEDHKCTGLEDCKKQSHERNAAQLESERTQVIRGV
jgi:hypothetical protein